MEVEKKREGGGIGRDWEGDVSWGKNNGYYEEEKKEEEQGTYTWKFTPTITAFRRGASFGEMLVLEFPAGGFDHAVFVRAGIISFLFFYIRQYLILRSGGRRERFEVSGGWVVGKTYEL